MELSLSVALTHALATAAPTLYRAQDAIDIAGTTPLLVRKHITTQILLPPLDQIDICQHAVLLKLLA